MFAIGVYGLNLNDPNITYFSVSLFQNTFSPIFQPISNTPIPMVPCTKDHFKFNKDTIELFHRLNLTYCLCPPLGYKFEIGGRVTSAIYKQISINV